MQGVCGLSCIVLSCVFSSNAGPLDLSRVPDCGIGVLTVKVQPQYAAHHGACKLTSDVRTRTSGTVLLLLATIIILHLLGLV